MYKYILSLMCFIIFLSFSSCKDKKPADLHDSPATTTEKVDMSGKEFTSKYICPMHCSGSGSDTTGTCPACGMDYVINKGDHEGHNHGHEGHNH